MDQVENNSSICNGSENNQTIEVVIHPDPVVESIRKIIQAGSSFSPKCSIYKVPKNLRSINPKVYTPQVISIGPYHYGRKDLMAMEVHKLSYLRSFLSRINLNSEEVVQIVRSWEGTARNCYAEPIKMKDNKFVKLLLVDGCFVVEFFIRRCYPAFRDAIDHLFLGRLNSDICNDLIKLENQLPFFVLQSLFQLCSSVHPIGNISFSELTHYSLGSLYKTDEKFKLVVSRNESEHFVGNLWLYFTPPPPSPAEQSQKGAAPKFLYPPTATKLSEAGVHFKKAEKISIGDVITGITFKKGVLEIPHIEIYDEFETYLRNLMAFEQCHIVDCYVSHFAMFMDALINTDKDVSLLINEGIISNYLGSNEDVWKLFNNLCKQVDLGCEFYLNDVCREMDEYCEKPRHRLMASLKRDYFNTPWAFLSSVAAILLLILTLTQTVFSGLSVSKAWRDAEQPTSHT